MRAAVLTHSSPCKHFEHENANRRCRPRGDCLGRGARRRGSAPERYSLGRHAVRLPNATSQPGADADGYRNVHAERRAERIADDGRRGPSAGPVAEPDRVAVGQSDAAADAQSRSAVISFVVEKGKRVRLKADPFSCA